MKVEELRRQLESLSPGNLRLVAEQLYRMLPKRMAEEKGADQLIGDPQAFLKSREVRRAPPPPDIGMVEFETSEFLENAREQRYFAPNRIIPKAQRTRWRFLVKRLYQDWCALAQEPENVAPAAQALEDLYRILCRGCEVYLFPSTDTFAAIGVGQAQFLEQVLLLKSRIFPPKEWIEPALSLLQVGVYGNATTAELQDAILGLLKTPELKEAALETVLGRLDESPEPIRGWEQTRERQDLIRLAFQIAWALGQKERALEYVRTRARKEDNAGDLILRLIFETRDATVWMAEYEAARRDRPVAAERWRKTFEEAQRTGELPNWQIG